jgi:membrane protease YdiL (CAAX protease family)
VTLAATWKAGLLHRIQARSTMAATEALVIVSVLILYLSFNGTQCQLPNLCISTDDSWSIVSIAVFLVAAGSNLLVGVSEEFLFRGYLMHEIIDNLGVKGIRTKSGSNFPVKAIVFSAAIFALWHVPHYSSLASGPLLVVDLGVVFASGLMYGMAYWWTDWNLAVPILSHFSFDAFGLVGPLTGTYPSSTELTLVGFPILAILVRNSVKRYGERGQSGKLGSKDLISNLLSSLQHLI